MPSRGFKNGTQNNQSKVIPSKRERKPSAKFEPTFEPTYKRKNATFVLEDEEEDLTNLDPTDPTFCQILSCMEQNIGKESGKLNDSVEDLLKSIQDIGNPDPKSQKAIDKLPEKARK